MLESAEPDIRSATLCLCVGWCQTLIIRNHALLVIIMMVDRTAHECEILERAKAKEILKTLCTGTSTAAAYSWLRQGIT
jgi:hypothetical protein